MKEILRGFALILLVFSVVFLSIFWLFRYIDSHYDEYRYHVRIIHCDGRYRDIYVIRRENSQPGFHEIDNSSNTRYIPVWGKYKNVCDIEILDKTLHRKAER